MMNLYPHLQSVSKSKSIQIHKQWEMLLYGLINYTFNVYPNIHQFGINKTQEVYIDDS